KDYLLREIEKIGTLIRMCLSKMTGSEENLAIQLDVEFEEDKGMLLHELGFDMNLFLMLDDAESKKYLTEIKGFNSQNIEYLADILSYMGLNTDSHMTTEYLVKALMVYEICSSLDKTFSFDREQKKSRIKSAL
ncbi:MAG: hypothetical protein KKB74_00825, partial [Bacteroidetes bacterium]|nr:hypothetical protein [Bacteroidota bacterium]